MKDILTTAFMSQERTNTEMGKKCNDNVEQRQPSAPDGCRQSSQPQRSPEQSGGFPFGTVQGTCHFSLLPCKEKTSLT